MKKIFYAFVILFATSLQVNAQCWLKIAPGGSHTLAIKNDGTLWAWGNNFHGALGDGTFTNRNTPVQIGTDANWRDISANEEVNATPKSNFSLAIKTDGTLWAWGNNSYRQLGIGPAGGDYNTPVQVGFDNDWLTVSAGKSYSLGIKTDSTLWAWGYNQNGELGLGDFTPRSIPVQVGTATNWAKISAGFEVSAALTTTGTIWTWGRNYAGQLGDGTTIDKNIPVQAGTATDWQMVSNSGLHMTAIKSDGTLWAWGQNSLGQLGDGTFTNSNIPLQIGTDNNWDTVVAGYQLTLALKTNSTRWAWGFNSYGEYGIGTLDWYIEPFQTGTATDWQTIAVKSYSAFGIRTGSNLWASGLNENGQIGDGTSVDKLSPVQILCNGILPVTWLYINGQWENNAAVIKWATASESNTSKFEIEHSNNGNNYSIIGTVAAAGNSSGTQHYDFLHSSPVTGKNHYRIKQIDLDGRFSYSAIIVLQKNTLQTNIIIAPNPVQEQATIYFDDSPVKTIQLINSSGAVLLTKTNLRANSSYQIDMRRYVPGIYLLRMQTENGIETRQIIKQ
jgi:alpha-tubulin suppressor-like RCC1 family protein